MWSIFVFVCGIFLAKSVVCGSCFVVEPNCIVASRQAILDVSTRNMDESISIGYEAGLVLPPQKPVANALNVSVGVKEGDGTGEPEGERSGFIVIRTNQSTHAITKIPYSAFFLKGSIGYKVQ